MPVRLCGESGLPQPAITRHLTSSSPRLVKGGLVESGLALLPIRYEATTPLECRWWPPEEEQGGTPNHSQPNRYQERTSKNTELPSPIW